jgi:hypothetical protein
VLAPWADLRAATHGIPASICPFNLGMITHTLTARPFYLENTSGAHWSSGAKDDARHSLRPHQTHLIFAFSSPTVKPLTAVVRPRGTFCDVWGWQGDSWPATAGSAASHSTIFVPWPFSLKTQPPAFMVTGRPAFDVCSSPTPIASTAAQDGERKSNRRNRRPGTRLSQNAMFRTVAAMSHRRTP